MRRRWTVEAACALLLAAFPTAAMSMDATAAVAEASPPPAPPPPESPASTTSLPASGRPTFAPPESPPPGPLLRVPTAPPPAIAPRAVPAPTAPPRDGARPAERHDGLAALLAAPELAAPAVVMLGLDRSGRMTVPVSIAGSTPHDFVVDTGAERTLLSAELAAALALRAGPGLRLLSMTGTVDAASVHVPQLGFGGGSLADLVAPTLAGRHIGAAGIVGLDGLQDKRVLLDFERGTMRVEAAQAVPEERWDADTIVVRARSRYGQLVLADADLDGTRVQIVLDTGAEVSVGNMALARLLARRRTPESMALMSVTGDVMTAERRVLARIRVGSATLSGLAVAFADAPPFARFGLADRPAMLLGMDALALFNRVSIDFVRRRVRLDPRDLAPGRAPLFAGGWGNSLSRRTGRMTARD